MNKDIVILMGNPDFNSLSAELADTYQNAATENGHTVTRFNLATLNFDPVLHHGLKEFQPLEPDLQTVQDAIACCHHLVIIYPNWWCAMPALLKGFFDRVWVPDFAFTEEGESTKPLLTGKTARVIVLTWRYSPLKTWWKFGDFTNEIQHAILGLAGFKASVSVFGPAKNVSPEKLESWKKSTASLASRAR